MRERKKRAQAGVAMSVFLVIFFVLALVGSFYTPNAPHLDVPSLLVGFVLGIILSGLVALCWQAIELAKKRVI